jgi:hypothetical protein
MLVLAAGVVFMAACSLSPLRLISSSRSTPQPPIDLKRCDDVQDVLCLLTFGLEPPDEMLILLLTVPGLSEELEIVATRNDEKLLFRCTTTAESPTVVYCTGPQVPLGTTVLIEVFANEEQVLLARGEFTLTALALPTVLADGQGLPTPPPLTARATRTTGAGTAFPTRPPFLTPLITQTTTPGAAYPNPRPAYPNSTP